ncbi:MAG: glycosyltransferase [Candidatus Coatesbacteria bacterium]|nr:glycosyltransferase [Candidatus Coatesbacteria bacterium]
MSLSADAPTISACLIVRDESSILNRCLSSLEGVADEIIVVDTGSVDNTKEVAARYTDKIYDFEWCDDFSAARNFANSKATGDWILTIDADEYIPEENRPLWKNALKAVDPPSPRLRRTGDPDYLMIMPRVYMMGAKKGPDGKLIVEQIFFGQRLLRRDSGIEWKRASHNVLEVPPEKCVRAEPLKVYHDRSARHNLRNLQRARQRQRMNLANLKQAVKENPSDRRSWFYLGNTHLDVGHHASAARCYRKYLAVADGRGSHERWQVAYYLARCYWALSRRHKGGDEAKYHKMLEKCRDALMASLLDDTERAEGYVLLGDVYIELKDYRKAVHRYSCATRCEIPKQNIFFIEPSYYTWVPHFQMAQCYDSLGEPARTRECLLNALRHSPDNEEILLSLARTDQVLEKENGWLSHFQAPFVSPGNRRLARRRARLGLQPGEMCHAR